VTATANGTPRTWESERTLDPASSRVDFRQVVTADPVAGMSGSWSMRPDPGGGCTVVLEHEYRAVGDDADALARITSAVDTNSGSELAHLKRAAEYGPLRDQLLVEFSDSEVVDGPLDRAFEFIRDAKRWPDVLGHVSRISVDEYGQGLQVVDMDTKAPDGSVHTTVSTRICGGGLIRYKQTRTAEVLQAHVGAWKFEDTDDGKVRVTSHHSVIMDPKAVGRLPEPPADLAAAARLVRRALGGNSRATMSVLKEHQEHQGQQERQTSLEEW